MYTIKLIWVWVWSSNCIKDQLNVSVESLIYFTYCYARVRDKIMYNQIFCDIFESTSIELYDNIEL